MDREGRAVMRQRDQVEADYERAIAVACGRGDNDEANELAIALRQYRELYKTPPDPSEREQAQR